jgi:predicted dehydrogenase
MSLKPVKVAIIGSGNISYTYMNTLTSGFSIVELVGCSDLIPEKSKARSELFGIRQMTTEEILKNPEIEIVLNLTEIKNHSNVTKMILEAGKHAYSEKSAGCAIDETQANLDLAKSKGLRFGCAPDTYMGAAYQTARKLIDDGWIGEPLAARGWCIRSRRGSQRPVSPDPEGNYVKKGTTITYDMSGYYNNGLVSLLGPVARCSGFAKAFDNHIWENTKHPDFGKRITVGSGANTIMAVYEFANGCYGSFFITSESFGKEIPLLEIFGTKGFLQVPDPNLYGGWGKDLYISRIGDEELQRIPFTHAFADTDPSVPPKSGKREPCHNSWRGIAVVDMAYAIRRNRPHRSSPELAMHNVEIISAIEENSQKNPAVYTLKSRPERPAPLAPGFMGPPEVMEGSIDNIR